MNKFHKRIVYTLILHKIINKNVKVKILLKKGRRAQGGLVLKISTSRIRLLTNLLTDHQFQSPLSQYQNHQHLLQVVVY